MAQIKNLGTGKPHEVSAAIVEKDGKILLFKRRQEPVSYAGPAGHVDEGEDFEKALIREVREEIGAEIESYRLLLEKVVSLYPCRYDGEIRHKTRIYEVQLKNEIRPNRDDFDHMVWVKKSELYKYGLDPAWKDYFTDLGYPYG